MRDVQSIWNRNCLKCHDYGKPGEKAVNLAPDLGIVFNTSYMSLRAKIALRWYPDAPGQIKELLKPVDDGPPDVLPAYAWGSHRSRLVDMLDAGHHGVSLTKSERGKIIEWIDLNTPYYPTYETAFPERPYGRSPLTFDQVRELVKVTGDHQSIIADSIWKRVDETRRLGTGVNFTRPELSPCLARIPADRRERALEIIRLGAEQLREYGRPDFGDGTLVRREIELKRVVPAQGCLSGASEIVFELDRPYDVTALDFVSVRAAGAHLPKNVDVVGEDGNVVARNLVVPHAGDGNVSTVPFRKVRTKRIGVRIADPDGWQLAAVRVRVPTFAGHLVLREEKDNY